MFNVKVDFQIKCLQFWQLYYIIHLLLATIIKKKSQSKGNHFVWNWSQNSPVVSIREKFL